MTQSNRVNLDRLLEEFAVMEQEVTDVEGESRLLHVVLEDKRRLTNFYLAKEKSLADERKQLLATVNMLQQTLQEQVNLRVENETLKKSILDLEQQSERRTENVDAQIQQLLTDMKVQEEKHKRELEAMRQQVWKQVEEAREEALSQVEAKDGEIKKLLKQKDETLEEMKKKLKEQEREGQSELLKVQMEFGVKFSRLQKAAERRQQQQRQHNSNLMAQNFLKRKLQIFQQEKNQEMFRLHQRITELEDVQRVAELRRRNI